MPRYRALFTADRLTPPTPEHIARIGKFVEQQARAGNQAYPKLRALIRA